MKVLILANHDVGLYQFRKELIEELLKEHSVLISLPYGKLVDKLVDMGCIYMDTAVDRRGINPVTDLSLLKRYFKIIKTQKPDLIITYTIKPNVYGGLVCRILKIPYAVNITGLGTAFQKQGLFRKLVTLLYKMSLKKAKVVFFENAENQKIFMDASIVRPEQAILLNGAGVNLEHYQFTEYPNTQEETCFLFVGRVMKEKGIDELFAAMQRLTAEGVPCTLDVLGYYEEDYEKIIQEYEAAGWLRYHGYQEDVRPFIAQAHCFVLSSWHEGMANTNLECAAMGRPIITSDIHGCKEAVVDGVSGFLCEKQNAESLYRTMKRFVGLGYEQQRDMGVAGRRHMEAVFDKKKVVRETVTTLYE